LSVNSDACRCRAGAAQTRKKNLKKNKEGAMAIVRWDPFQEVAQLQDRVNRVFGDTFSRNGADEAFMTTGEWTPPVDIYANGDQELVLKAELPDMTLDDIDVRVDNGALTIKGEKKVARDLKQEQFHRVERRYGTFSRSFSLPQTVDPHKVAADYKHGVLTVRLPLREEAKPRQIKINVTA
jgi:HSP20 family protein